MSNVFLDTNVLAYRFDESEPEKRARAIECVRGKQLTFCVSTQVMLELFVVLTRKLRPAMSESGAQRVVSELAGLTVVPADAALVLRAVATSRAHRLSIWDAMVVEAAVDAGCEEVWTEDLATDATIRGVRIVNPLAP